MPRGCKSRQVDLSYLVIFWKILLFSSTLRCGIHLRFRKNRKRSSKYPQSKCVGFRSNIKISLPRLQNPWKIEEAFAINSATWGRFFFRRTQTFCKHCALTISDIVMRFLPTNGERNREKYVRDRFLHFVTWSAEESDKVENYRFLENCSMEFAENRREKSVFNILSPPFIKNSKIGSENFRIFFRLYMCR